MSDFVFGDEALYQATEHNQAQLLHPVLYPVRKKATLGPFGELVYWRIAVTVDDIAQFSPRELLPITLPYDPNLCESVTRVQAALLAGHDRYSRQSATVHPAVACLQARGRLEENMHTWIRLVNSGLPWWCSRVVFIGPGLERNDLAEPVLVTCERPYVTEAALQTHGEEDAAAIRRHILANKQVPVVVAAQWYIYVTDRAAARARLTPHYRALGFKLTGLDESSVDNRLSVAAYTAESYTARHLKVLKNRASRVGTPREAKPKKPPEKFVVDSKVVYEFGSEAYSALRTKLPGVVSVPRMFYCSGTRDWVQGTGRLCEILACARIVNQYEVLMQLPEMAALRELWNTASPKRRAWLQKQNQQFAMWLEYEAQRKPPKRAKPVKLLLDEVEGYFVPKPKASGTEEKMSTAPVPRKSATSANDNCTSEIAVEFAD